MSAQQQDGVYFPGAGASWERRRAEQVGFDTARLAEAVRFAQANPMPWRHDLARQIQENIANEVDPRILGPVKERGDTNGLVVRHGYIVAEWGPTDRVDMTFSISKSLLSTVAGLAYDRGLLPDLEAPVGHAINDGGFDSPHNARITWHQLLQQTSEWQGTLWEKTHYADPQGEQDQSTPVGEPGSVWAYNDTRVNRLSLSLLRLWQRSLPAVLNEHIMTPIGASDSWQWHGYDNSWITLNGQAVQSVSGGGHWGGGVWISARDLARFGYLFLRRGAWQGRSLLSNDWIGRALTPCPIKPEYGYLWWLNTDRILYPSATPHGVAALGAGGNAIWIDPDHDLVVVLRWVAPEARDGLFARLQEALTRQ